jgi:hypothetical protein
MHDGGTSASEARQFVKNVILASGFDYTVLFFKHCNREGNTVAHFLAAHLEGVRLVSGREILLILLFLA